jgi:hypothetical protein
MRRRHLDVRSHLDEIDSSMHSHRNQQISSRINSPREEEESNDQNSLRANSEEEVQNDQDFNFENQVRRERQNNPPQRRQNYMDESVDHNLSFSRYHQDGISIINLHS